MTLVALFGALALPSRHTLRAPLPAASASHELELGRLAEGERGQRVLSPANATAATPQVWHAHGVLQDVANVAGDESECCNYQYYCNTYKDEAPPLPSDRASEDCCYCRRGCRRSRVPCDGAVAGYGVAGHRLAMSIRVAPAALRGGPMSWCGGC